MKLFFFAAIFLGFVQRYAEYEIIVNGSVTNDYVYRDRPNSFVVKGADAASIKLSSPQATMKLQGGKYVLTLEKDYEEIIVQVAFVQKGEHSLLGYYKFRVI